MLGTFENDPFALTMLYQGLLAYLQRFLQFCHLMAKSNWSR